MKHNPIWQEYVEVFYNQGHGLVTYLYLILILAPVALLSLYLPSLDTQMWSGAASLFKVSAVTTLLLLVYFSLRVANQEFAPWRFRPLRYWVREAGQTLSTIARAQLTFLSAHIGLSLAICLPILLWSAAIARTPLSNAAWTLVLLFVYGFSYGVWGLVSLVLWERRGETRQVFVRCFFLALLIISALVYLPVNPLAFVIAFVGSQDLPPLNFLGQQWQSTTVHLTFHALLALSGYSSYRWALRRELAG